MRTITIGLLLGSICLAQKPDPRIGRILNDLSSTRSFEEVAISPDGRRVAWVEELIENGKDTGKSAIFVKDLKAGAAARISAKPAASERNLAWSPDSSQIAFLSDRDHPGQMQLHVISWNGQRARKLTSFKGYLTDPRWSPDGTRIAFLFAENAAGGGGPLEAEPVETGVIGSEIHNQRLTIVDAATGAAKQVSPADLNIYEYDWSPDGKKFALSAAPGPGDNNWWIAKLYTMPSDQGAMTALYTPETQVAMPRWSPDGSTIGFIQGLMSDEEHHGRRPVHHSGGGRRAAKTIRRDENRRSVPSNGNRRRRFLPPSGPADRPASRSSISPPAKPNVCGRARRTPTSADIGGIFPWRATAAAPL